MGLVGVGLATVTVGYILGVWTVCAISSWPRDRDHLTAPEGVATHSSPSIAEVTVISAPRA